MSSKKAKKESVTTGSEEAMPGSRQIITLDKKMIAERFWAMTSRKRGLVQGAEDLSPAKLHHWGKLNNIKGNSPTLKTLVEGCGLRAVTDFKDTFNKVLAELDIEYSIEDFKSFDQTQKAIAYDIKTVPAWSFCGIASTKENAIAIAAERGLDFFISLSD